MYGLDLGRLIWAGPGVPVARLANLILRLPRTARIFDDLGLGDRARWTTTDELLAAAVELLDVQVRKGTRRREPLIRIRRPATAGDRPKPVPMSDPRARAFFGRAVRKPTPPTSRAVDS